MSVMGKSDGSVDPLYIGQHCSVKSCGTLDFLPIKCSYCQLIYCKEHHTPYTHKCDKVPEKQIKSDVEYKSSLPCHICQIVDIVNVVCEECTCVCCMSHRTLEQHNCKTLPSNQPPTKPPTLPPTSSVKGVSLKRKGAKSLALERKVMVMKMKNKSKGPSSVPPEERIFINVTREGTKDPCFYHFSVTWTVGRCVDHVADYLKMKNNNDKTGYDVLVMCYDSHVLPMSEKLSKLTESGDTVLLRYQPET